MAHLTIAFIHGNCGAALMRRFLDSFAPLAGITAAANRRRAVQSAYRAERARALADKISP